MRTPALLLLLLLASCGTGEVRSAPPAERMPRLVHVSEDFETDIEKRWWLAGTLETANVPPGSRRACRGTVSKDFDDKMGDPKARYTAVVFNPVPGPPMGRETRLRFRYWLRGTDRLRVQIFSLSNNYHRRLELTGLPQGSWHWGSVDMTQLRRPDGSGGPLSQDERIDDIQFYVDLSAELIIDDIVLYDAAAPEETEPFPSKLIFAGGFDTGKQGQEWPGVFEIVSHEKPLRWKAAKSVTGTLVVSLRGSRPVSDPVRLRFRCRVTGADGFQLFGNTVRATRDEWQEMRLAVPAGAAELDSVAFSVKDPGVLWVDDLLVYEP